MPDEVFLRADAAAGDRAAMTELGVLAERAGDVEQAWGWWRRAAFAGDEPAMRHLARALRRTRPDEAQLWRWHGVVAGKQRAAGGPPRPEVVAAAERVPGGPGPLLLTYGHGDRAPAEAGLGCGATLVAGLAAAGLFAQLSGAVVAGVVGYVLAVAAAAALVVGWSRVRGRRHPGVWEYANGVVARTGDGVVAAAGWPDIALVDEVLTVQGVTLPLPADAFPQGEQQVLVHRLAHRSAGPPEPGDHGQDVAR